MNYEIELYFGGDEYSDPYMTVTFVNFNTGTELANFAHSEAKKQGAIGVSFGPSVPRNEYGQVE
jgi:hypothetical protein